MAHETQTTAGRRTPGKGRKEPQPPPQQAAPARGPTHEEIARRAYELWRSRGGQGGSEHDDWLQAERELRLGRY